MEIKEDNEFRELLLKRIADREFSERKGVHASDLIYCLNKQAMRRLHPKPSTAKEILLFSLGWSTQRWLTGMDDDEASIEVDGIQVTPDVLLDDKTPWELKATYQSATKSLGDNINWIKQVMAQCYVTGTTTARLSRLEIMGEWRWVWNGRAKEEKLAALVEEFGENWDEHPTLHAWKLTFTKEELQRNWEQLKARRDLFLQILETGTLLPKAVSLDAGMDYECKFCGYKKECGEE